MNCQRVKVLLSAYQDETLPARLAGSVAGHLARCGACRRELQSLETAMAALDRVRPSTPPIDLWERFQARLAEQAASLPCFQMSGAGPQAPVTAGGSRQGSGHGDTAHRRPASSAWRMLFAPFAAAPLLAVGFAGYRIGIEEAPDTPGVIASALVPRPAAASARNGDAPEPRFRLSIRQAPLATAVAPPEATMRPWTRWGPSDRTVNIEEPNPERDDTLALMPRAFANGKGERRRVPAAQGSGESRIETSAGPAPPALPPPSDAAVLLASGDREIQTDRVEALASAHLAGALQASIEAEARRQVADEVALLAQALKRSGTAPNGQVGPAQPEEAE
jgi:HAMP domain-containing protein